MAKKQFKAESKRLLNMMIHSIYTNKEIFIRELISNASDALDKRYYLSLTNDAFKVEKKKLVIRIQPNKELRTLVIEDTGIGMTNTEMEENLGTIAKSGSADFKESLEKNTKNVDIIGQFGVGFYSAFMVAKKITVESLKAGETQAYRWISSGEDGYTIEAIDRQEVGTTITIELNDDTDDDKFSNYLEEYTIRNLIKKYSDYVRYPIVMNVTKEIPDPTDESKFIETHEDETLNSMVPLWKKSRSKIKAEEYNEFYQAKFNDFMNPQKVIHFNVEGNISYSALLFIPAKTPYNFYNNDFEAGLQLYSKGVFIFDKAKELLPEAYRFVTGLIDSDDISLNISREILQQDRQVKALATSLEKKIHKALEDMLKDERESYETFFDHFGTNLKYAIYKSFGSDKEKLQDLLLYKTSKEGKYSTLKEYVERMPEGQTEIYYACGSSMEDIEKLPALAKLKEKGYEVLYFTENVDEFTINMMREYHQKQFKSISTSDLNLESEEEKKERTAKAEENKDMLAAMKDALNQKVQEVKLSSRLIDDPVVLVAAEGLSIEMEKVLSMDPNNSGMKATKILELNPNHAIFSAMKKVFENDKEKFNAYTNVLFDQACLIEGLAIENPVEYARQITNLMIEASK